MDKYTKHRFFTALLVLEIRASLYSIPSDAIFITKFAPFSETHRTAKFIFCMRYNTPQNYFLKPQDLLSSNGQD